MFHANGHAGRHDEANSRFSEVAKAPKNMEDDTFFALFPLFLFYVLNTPAAKIAMKLRSLCSVFRLYQQISTY
jgi:hypothetical protein